MSKWVILVIISMLLAGIVYGVLIHSISLIVTDSICLILDFINIE